MTQRRSAPTKEAGRRRRPWQMQLEIIDEARKPGSPLHGLLEWNDALAAQGYRRARLIGEAEFITHGRKSAQQWKALARRG